MIFIIFFINIASAQSNLALSGTATQSSTTNGGIASKAIDGNQNGDFFIGSVTHTDHRFQEWWEVDLGSIADITSINLYNRTDCCLERGTNYHVFVSDVPFNSTTVAGSQAQPGVLDLFDAGTIASPTILSVNRTGRFVRVQISTTNAFSLAEVEVFGTRAPEINLSSSENAIVSDAGSDAQGIQPAGIAKIVTYTINNSGTVSLNITGTPTAANLINVAAPVITAPTSATVAPGGSTTFTVTYTPTIASAFSFDLDIISDDIDESPYDISVSGIAQDIVFPVFTNVPANINQSTDVGLNTAVVTFTPPTATDNVDGAITPTLVTSPTAGLNSGSAFPVGTTTLTYQATDTAGNIITQSFTVTVTAAQGTITFIVNSEADGLYKIQSLEPMLNIPIIASSGGGQSSVISLRPGTFPITFKAPNGVGIENANCNNENSTLNVESLTGTIVITSDEAVTCTIKALDSFKETTAQISQFIESRSQLILQNQPDLARQINHLERRYNNNGGIKGFGLALNDNRIPLSAQIGTAKISFSYSSHQSHTNRIAPTLTGDAVSVLAAFGITPRAINKGESPFYSEVSPTTLEKYITDTSNISSEKALNLKLPTVSNTQPSNKNYDYKTNPFGIWAEGNISKFKTNNGKGRFFITQIGADYLIKPDVLIGLSIQGDWLNMDGKNTESKTEGTGFLITPYVTAKLSEDLYLNANVGWGKSYNDISPFGTYTDSFNSERWIASAALIGKWKLNGFNIEHGTYLTYFKETSDSYTDSLSVFIPSVETETGTFKIGPTLSKNYTTDKGSIYTPFLTMNGIWTFSQNNRTTAFNQKSRATKGLRGRLELGLDIYSDNSSQFKFSTNYDGIGDSNFESWGLILNYNYQF